MRSYLYVCAVAIIAILAVTLGSVRPAKAQIIGQYDFSGTAAGASSVSASGVVSGVTLSDLTRGNGLTANGSGGTFTSFGFDFGSGDTALTGGDFLQFTITPNAGFSLSLTGFTYTDSATNPGPDNIVVRSSADGFLSDLAAYTTTTAGTARDVTLEGPAFTNLTAPLTFRILGFGANNANAGSSHSLQTNPLVIQGSASAVAPEPGSLVLAAFGALPLAGIARLRRRRNR